jgi:hypothetical protein
LTACFVVDPPEGTKGIGFSPKALSPHMNPTQESEWRKHLRAHDRKLLATIVVMMGAYFAALIAVVRWALASFGH